MLKIQFSHEGFSYIDLTRFHKIFTDHLDIVGHPEILAKRAPISRSFLAVRHKKSDQPASLKSTTSRQRSERNGKLRIFALLTLQEYYFTRFSLIFPSIFRKEKTFIERSILRSIVGRRYILSVRFSRVNFLIHRIKFFLFFFFSNAFRRKARIRITEFRFNGNLRETGNRG